VKKIISVIILSFILSNFIGCQEGNNKLTDKYVKFYNIELISTGTQPTKLPDGKEEQITGATYSVVMQLKDPSYTDKITAKLNFTGETFKIIGMSGIGPDRILKNGNKYEVSFGFGSNVLSKSDLDILQKNLVKEVELEIIENKQ
jgi:hypothetical protein